MKTGIGIIIAFLLFTPIISSAVISGIVTEQTMDGSLGNVISNAKITAYLVENQVETEIVSTTSDNEGKFSLDIGENHGEYLVMAEKEEYFNGGVGGLQVNADYELFDDDLTMSKIQWGSVYGTVNCGGEPAEGALVSADSDYKNFSTTTNREGEYELELPKNVAFKLTFEKENCVTSSITNVYAMGIDFSMDLGAVQERPPRPEITPEEDPKEIDTPIEIEIEQEGEELDLTLVLGAIVLIIIILGVFWFLKKKK